MFEDIENTEVNKRIYVSLDKFFSTLEDTEKRDSMVQELFKEFETARHELRMTPSGEPKGFYKEVVFAVYSSNKDNIIFEIELTYHEKLRKFTTWVRDINKGIIAEKSYICEALTICEFFEKIEQIFSLSYVYFLRLKTSN